MPVTHEFLEELDAACINRRRVEFEQLACVPGDLTLDFSKVGFVDSSGLGLLVFLHKRLASRGQKVRIVGLQGQPLQLFTNLRLVSVFCD